MKTAVTLLMLFALAPLSSSAQDYTQWSLPEGAKVRLGKGHITGNIAYSSDGTRFAMASGIGIWVYDGHTGEELALLTGHTEDVSGVSFSPDNATLASGSRDGTVLCGNTTAKPSLHPEALAMQIPNDLERGHQIVYWESCPSASPGHGHSFGQR